MAKTNPNDKYIKSQQSGCAARIYYNSPQLKNTTEDLFWEIKKATVSRTIKDIGGSFTLYLQPTQPWDEIIQGDDWIRIFMGDEISSGGAGQGAVNFATGNLGLIPNVSALTVPLPGSPVRYGDNKAHYSQTATAGEMIMMYERMLGKVDRVQKVTKAPTRTSGTTTMYVVSGRSFGAILQDTIIQYNDFIPGLDSISLWFKQTADTVEKSPSELVHIYIRNLLTIAPMPQWQLPARLIADYISPEDVATKVSALSEIMVKFLNRVQEDFVKKHPTSAAFEKLQYLINNSLPMIATSPLMIINLDSIKETFGKIFNTTFLGNVSGSACDFLKYLSNAQFNEFWCDLLPSGDVEGGAASKKDLVPSVVMRQRPFNIDGSMLTSLTRPLHVETYYKAPSVGDFSKSLFDLADQAITIYGPSVADTDLKEYVDNSMMRTFGINETTSAPTVIDYQMGYTSVARFNSFLCLGSYSSGRDSNDKLILSESGGYLVDIKSVAQYGFRSLEVTSPYAAAPNDPSNPGANHLDAMIKFTQLLGNWYSLNHILLDGTMTCGFLKDARLGIPCAYIETKKSATNPYAKLEVSYIQAVQDDYEFGRPLTTTLTLTRGLRYNLELYNPYSAAALLEKFGELNA